MPVKNAKFKRYRLMTPGPVPLLPKVQKILAEPMIHHRTPKFEATLKSVLNKLKLTFQTKQTVFPLTATGSGAMECAIINTLSPGEEVLVVVSGKFGERWAEMCRRFGLKVHALEVPWGDKLDINLFKNEFDKLTYIKAVLTQACETSTATMHPVKEMAQIVAGRPNILFMVDAITALGAMPLPMDDWGLDVVVSGSQKAFMLPTGLSFIALSKKAWAKHDEAKCPRYYFDLTLQKRAIEKGETYFSSSISLIRALDVALDHLTGKALLKSIRRSDKMAKAIRRACLGLGFKPFSKAPSPSVTALLIPDGVDGVKLRRHIEDKYNITVMGGQDKLQGKILRIGHLGYITDDDVLKTIEALYLSLNDMGQGLNKTALTKALKIAKKELK